MYYLQHEKTGEYVAAIIKLRGEESAYAVYFGPNPSVPSWKTESAARKALDRLLDCAYTNPRGVALDLVIVNPEEKKEVAHMNEMAAVQASAPARSLMEIETEIRHQKNVIGEGYVKIGLALIEAKKQLSHGEWAGWLRDRVNFSQSSAEGYMRVAREYGTGSQLLNLPYTKVLALLAVPAEERETFAEANNIEDKSVAQIKQLIKERDVARAEAAQAKQSAREQMDRADGLYKKMRDAEDQSKRQAKDSERLAVMLNREREHVAQLMAREPDTVTVEKEVPPADYDAIKVQNAKLEDQLKTAMVRLNQAEDSLEEAEERASRAQAEAQRAKMEQIDTADPEDPLEVASFAHACFDFTGALYAAPIGAKYFAGKSAEDLQRYRLVANSVLTWAQNTLRAIGEAEAMQATGGDDYVVA